MQPKIFDACGSGFINRINRSMLGSIEDRENRWLRENPDIKVVEINRLPVIEARGECDALASAGSLLWRRRRLPLKRIETAPGDRPRAGDTEVRPGKKG